MAWQEEKKKKKANKLRLKYHITIGGAHCQLIRAGFRAQELELQSIFRWNFVARHNHLKNKK